MTGLTNQQQAILMLAVFVLPAVIAWLSLGAPISHTSLALLLSAVFSGVLVFIKEYLGIASTTAAKQ